MSGRLWIAWLPDGKRLHLRHGPVDLILQAFGRPGDIARAYDAAIARTRLFDAELQDAESPVLQRIAAALAPIRTIYALPSEAAAAGAVADEVLQAMCEAGRLDRAFVNNRHMVALHLGPGQSFAGAVVDRPGAAVYDPRWVVRARSSVRGVAASPIAGGPRLGLAEIVKVVSVSATAAQIAAMMIAAATDLPEHPGLVHLPAHRLDAQTALGDWPVLAEAGAVVAADLAQAMAAGEAMVQRLYAAGLISGARMQLLGQARNVTAAIM
ncbi:MAG: hypothetical protein B7Z81_00410 [Acidocella sp. 20-61-6]|nr:MAG: hypothetical protein B7Z81_00410 [Acidocella sp. 20-61-6]